MARKRKKPVSRPSIAVRLFYLTGRLVRWLVRLMVRYSRKNPLLASGLALFMITFGFVSYNAFFRQPDIHRDVFFSTRAQTSPAAVPAGPGRFAPAREAVRAGHAGGRAAFAAGNDMDLKVIQKKLSALGFYNGQIDGLSGPQTMQAIKRWEQLQKSLVNAGTVSPEVTDSIGAVIRNQAGPAVNHDAGTKTAMPPTRETVMRVQSGLRSFGNGDIVVNGVVDPVTEKAVRAFQNAFFLPVTGRIDHALINKMREIGLLG